MKYLVIYFATFFSLMSVQSHAETFDTKDPRWKQLSQAYGFAVAMQGSLENIEKKFPDLARDVKDSWFAYHSSALGESSENVEKELIRETGDKWPEVKERMIPLFNELTSTQEMNHTQAVEFLKEVHERSKGQLPKSLLATLLSANPRYLKQPENELIEGWRQTFRTKGLPEANGADFSVSIPASWINRDVTRPGVIQMFQSGAGHGPIICNLIAASIPPPQLTKKELKDFFTPSGLKETIPDGGKYLTSQKIVLEDLPAAILVYDLATQRMDAKFKFRTTQFMILHNNTIITIQFMVQKLPNEKRTLDQLQKHFLPTFKSIANTIALNDRYK